MIELKEVIAQIIKVVINDDTTTNSVKDACSLAI